MPSHQVIQLPPNALLNNGRYRIHGELNRKCVCKTTLLCVLQILAHVALSVAQVYTSCGVTITAQAFNSSQ